MTRTTCLAGPQMLRGITVLFAGLVTSQDIKIKFEDIDHV